MLIGMLLLIGVACSPSRKLTETQQGGIVLDTAYVPDPTETPFEGEVRYAARWVDNDGVHVLVVSGSETYAAAHGNTNLYIKLFDIRKRPTLVFEIHENVMGTGCDRMIDLPRKMIHIQDLDADGIAEAMLCYTLDNRCDAVPVDARLLLLSRGKPHWIRGYANQYLGPPQNVIDQRAKEEGTKPYLLTEPDAAMQNAPKALKEFAIREWGNWVMEEN